MADHLVVFTPSGKRGRFAEGVTLLAAARTLGVDLDSVCGGRGICGRCQIAIAEGHFAKHGIASDAAHASRINAVEVRYGEKRGLTGGRRLGCQAVVMGDLVVDVPAESQLHRQIVRKEAEARPIAIDPVVRLHYVTVRAPDMDDPASDFARLRAALAEQWGIEDARAPLAVLAHLQKTLRQGDWGVTVALREGRTIVALWPGVVTRSCGLAIDIGSTTIAAHLCDLATGDVVASVGTMNPQIRFGEDLMSRVSYVMMNPGGERELTDALRQAIDALIGEAAMQAGIARDAIVEMTAVGNPVMHHLFLGLDPTELGGAPFALTTDAGMSVPARDLGLTIAPGGFVYLLPCIAGHVGADASAMVLAEAPETRAAVTLLVDVGTNAEIVLGNSARLLACSSPTGPALEGAQIACGQRAAPGAIERLRIDRATFEPRYQIIGCDLWSDEPGFEAAAATTGVTGLCGSGIIEAIAELFLSGLMRADGTIDGSRAAETPRIEASGRVFSYLIREGAPRIVIYQSDIRAVQLAKAALHAGATLLMQRLGVGCVDEIVLAGAFGSHIDPLYASVLGLVPDCAREAMRSAGNAAGTGARMALLNAGARAHIESLVTRIVKIETATEPDFQRLFVDAMAFPHRTEPYSRLRSAIDLPAREAAAETGAAAGRNRRRARPAG